MKAPRLKFAIAAGLTLGLCGPALADSAPDYGANLFGDLAGARPAFARIGGTISLTESSEVFALPAGGAARGPGYDGLTTLTVELDTKPALHLDGGLFHVTLLQLHGENISYDDLRVLQTISGVQGDRATRLWELWYQQKFGEHFDLKLGEQSLDNEFFNHPSAGYFVNAAFGWPILGSLDMPGGGPAYPLAALGVRARAQAGPSTILAGVFSGAPASGSPADPQHANAYGVSFPVRGALAIAEAQYATGQGEGEYAGVYKLGVWYDSLDFADQRYDATGLPLASPAAGPTPRRHTGDYGLYAVAEQVVWRGAEKERTLSLFLRPTLSPQSDRNFVTFGLDGGLALRDPLPGRKDDTLALGFGYERIGAGAVGASVDAAAYNPGVYTPKRAYEAVFEATYQYQAAAAIQLQPDLQYIRNPGGGLANPYQPSAKIDDAWVTGLRVNISF